MICHSKIMFLREMIGMNEKSDNRTNGTIRYYYVSCNADDSARVSAVCRRMNQMGAAIWHDNGNVKGDEWVRHITGRINGCHEFLLFVTKELMARENRFVRNEFFFARKSMKKMYAVMLDDISAEDVNDSLRKWFSEINHICRIIKIPAGTPPSDAAKLINDVIHFAPDKSADNDTAVKSAEQVRAAEQVKAPEQVRAAEQVKAPEQVRAAEENAADGQVKATENGKKHVISKKTVTIGIAAVCVAVLAVLGTVMLLHSFNSDDPSCYVYDEQSDGIIITSLANEELTSLSIPEKIQGKPVIMIGESAFSGCTSLTHVRIPGTVREIGNSAFMFCDNLTHVDIPNSVTKIGASAFSECKALKGITLPKSVAEISDSAFQNCESLRSVKIPDSVNKIGESAFLPDSVTFIGGNAFEGCSALKEVSMSNNVSQINYSAFEGCTSLTEAVIPESVREIGDYAFSGCTKLRKAVIPESVEIIVDSAFLDCPALTVFGKSKSSAEQYAQAHDIPFKAQ